MADRIPDPQQDALFREVDDDLRHEQFSKLWKAYGSWVIAAAVLIVVVVAGHEGWQAWQRSVRTDEARAYEQAMTRVQAGEDAGPALSALAKTASTGHRDLARLQEAALLLKQGKAADAVAVYQALYADSKTDRVFADLARILAVQHGMDLPGADVKALDSVLTPLLDPASPFRHLAAEAKALLALQDKRTDDAKAQLNALFADKNTPAGIKTRARNLLSALGAEPAQG